MLNFKNLSEKQALTYTVIGAIVMFLIPLGALMWVQHQTGAGIFANLMANPDNLTAQLVKLQGDKASTDAYLNKEKPLTEELTKLRDESERYSLALPDSENLADVYKMIGEVIDSIGTIKIDTKDVRAVKHERKVAPKPVVAAAAAAAATTTPTGAPAPAPVVVAAKDYPVDYVETVWKLEGKFQDIMSFIHTVEDVNFKRFFMISDIRMTPVVENKEDANLDNLVAEITFICFFLTKDTKAEKAK